MKQNHRIVHIKRPLIKNLKNTHTHTHTNTHTHIYKLLKLTESAWGVLCKLFIGEPMSSYILFSNHSAKSCS